MQAVTDFCGYRIPDDKYGIKEFSIYYMDKYFKVVRKIFNIVKPPCDWHSLKPETKTEYTEMQKKHGIDFNSGLCNYNISICVLYKYLKRMKAIYVKDDIRKDLLAKYILRSEKYNIICMNGLGYDRSDEMRTKCGNHEDPDKYNCVNDNAVAMVDWLLKNKPKGSDDQVANQEKVQDPKEHTVITEAADN